MTVKPHNQNEIEPIHTAIIGNGLIGALTQLIFKRNGWPYMCFGQKPKKIKKQLLLNPQSIQFLESLNINPPIKSKHTRLKISAYHHRAKIIYDEENPICYAIDAGELLSEILQHILHSNVEIKSIKQTNDTYILSTANKTYQTTYLVGCDGNTSISRKAAQINTQYRSTQYYTIIPGQIEGRTLFQHHDKNMTLAVLPGQEGMLILTSSKPIDLQSISLQSLQTKLKHQFQIHSIQSPMAIQHQPCIAQHSYQDRCLLLGDAALSIEPVAAQGFNHALRNLETVSKLPKFCDSHLNEQTAIFDTRNMKLFRDMEFIHSQTLRNRLIKSTLLHMNMLSPIIKQQLMYFGNRYD